MLQLLLRADTRLTVAPMRNNGCRSLMQCCDAGVATPGDLEAAYVGAVRGEKGGGVHLLRLCQKTGPVWGQLSTGTCRALLEVFIKHVRVRYAGRLVCLWLGV